MKSLIFFALTISLISSQHKIPKIEVYVESLCPDCVNFIAGEFTNFYLYNNPNLAEVNFIPYGNAEEAWNETTHRWDFTCQHKENECYGNLIETCSIYHLGRVKSYDVIMCIENNIAEFGLNFDDTLAHCVTDSVLLNEIKECVGSEFGNKIQHEMAQKTAKHSWVPWIVVDGVHDETVENAILTDMIGYLCSLPHANCNENYTLKYYNPITNNPFLIIDRCYADEMK
jgi:interferon gamma-inducible protein 30